MVLYPAKNGEVAHRDATVLGLIDYAVIECHGPRTRFIDAGIAKAALVEDGDGNQPGRNDAAAVGSQLQQGGGAQLVGSAVLWSGRSQSGHQQAQQREAGLKTVSAI